MTLQIARHAADAPLRMLLALTLQGHRQRTADGGLPDGPRQVRQSFSAWPTDGCDVHRRAHEEQIIGCRPPEFGDAQCCVRDYDLERDAICRADPCDRRCPRPLPSACISDDDGGVDGSKCVDDDCDAGI